MSNELMLFATGEMRPRRSDRAVAQRAKTIFDETRVAGFQAEAIVALGTSIMNQAVGLDQHRQQLSNGDPVLDAVLCRIEVETVQNALRMQAGLVSSWGF